MASPAYLRATPPIETPDDLVQHAILMWRRPGRRLDRWAFDGPTGTQTVQLQSTRTANDGAVLRAWAVAGLGIAHKARLDVRSELEAGTLVDVLPQWRGAQMPLQALMPSRDYRPARVKQLLTHLVRAFGALAAA